MFDRIRVLWYRLTRGEDIFDGWPGEDVDPTAGAPPPQPAEHPARPNRS